ncbi:hypothetical protein AB5N19_12393 [Seiridium cardinale]|uniref:Uncharacterized protein n=1 Tax=Seiridium cardinale TaxID=138064 RepID=A0ABR2XTD4_9PEZI
MPSTIYIELQLLGPIKMSDQQDTDSNIPTDFEEFLAEAERKDAVKKRRQDRLQEDIYPADFEPPSRRVRARTQARVEQPSRDEQLEEMKRRRAIRRAERDREHGQRKGEGTSAKQLGPSTQASGASAAGSSSAAAEDSRTAIYTPRSEGTGKGKGKGKAVER